MCAPQLVLIYLIYADAAAVYSFLTLTFSSRLARLASFCAGYKVFTITLSRGYGEEEFRENLKELYVMLGEGETTFLFTDAHVVEEGFLELINNMLSTGMVPALYESDERDVLISSVRKEVKASGIPDTGLNCWKYYINKCRNNLHVVLAMSPSGSTLRGTHVREYPTIAYKCARAREREREKKPKSRDGLRCMLTTQFAAAISPAWWLQV